MTITWNTSSRTSSRTSSSCSCSCSSNTTSSTSSSRRTWLPIPEISAVVQREPDDEIAASEFEVSFKRFLQPRQETPLNGHKKSGLRTPHSNLSLVDQDELVQAPPPVIRSE